MAQTASFHELPIDRASATDGVSAARPGPRAVLHDSLATIERTAWDALVDGSVEGYDLYRALESVPPPGFTFGALTVEEPGRLLAAAPLFRARFRLDTPFQGATRGLGDRLHAAFPNLTSLRIMGLGSPMSDNCSIGLHPALQAAETEAVRNALLGRLFAAAKAERAQVLVVKCLGPEADSWHGTLTKHGFARIRSVPTVILPVPYASLDHYLGSLPEKTGSYLKRKMRAAAKLRIEYRGSIEGLEERIMALHDATLAQSSVDYGEFDKLHPDYFRSLLGGLGDRAKLMLCWKGDELLSFQVFLVGEKRIIANKIGMKYPEAREHNLYFVNWLKMIELATERGIPEIEMGATTYGAKILFGGKLDTRWIYFRMRWPGIATLTKPLHGLFDFERNDPELQKLAAAAAQSGKQT